MDLPKPDPSQIVKLKQKNSLLNTLENKGTQIAVVGDTSTGKSTTINFLLGFPVNFEASGIGTRRPCVICQEFDPKADDMHFRVAFLPAGGDERHYSDVAGVAAEVREANNPANESYWPCIKEQRVKDGTLLHEDLVFDIEPIYVTMCHKSFVYGLRLIDLPGLTSSCPAPMEIAKTYIQPGNVCVLVIGTDNPANAQFPKLAAKMSQCRKVIFMQNFAKSIIERVPDNLSLIQQKFREAGCAKLASELKLFCTDYGFPKLQKYVDRGLWKEGEGQEDWIEMSSTVADLTELREAMWTHALNLAKKLTAEQGDTIKGSIGAGIEEPLTELINFQLANIDAELATMKEMVRASIEEKERQVKKLAKECKLLSDPPQWSALLSRAAKVVSEFLDTTVEVRTENYESIATGFNERKVDRFEGMTVSEEASGGDTHETWSGSDAVDKAVVQALQKCGTFKAGDKLLCLRSWIRLLDEFTAALAFNPMCQIKEQHRRNQMELFDLGSTGLTDKPEAILRLVCDANSKQEPIRGQLALFRDRLTRLVERDIGYAIQVFACDETGEIASFLQVVGVSPDEQKAVGMALVNDIKEVILDQAKKTIETNINGCRVFDSDGRAVKTRDGKEEWELGSGMITRRDENALKPQGALHWILPFKSHYLNGQIPWRSLKWTNKEIEGVCMSDEAKAKAPTASHATQPDPAPAADADADAAAAPAAPPAEEPEPVKPAPEPELLEELKKEVSDAAKAGEPPTMNYTNAVNMRIYELATEMYDVSLTPKSATLADYELEALKLLKAMQAEVASFFSACWLPMLQALMDKEKIADFIIGQHMKPALRKAGVLDINDIVDSYDYVITLLAGRPGRDNTNVIGFFFSRSYDGEGMQQTTQEELRDLEQKMKNDKYRKYMSHREKPWNGGMDTANYLDMLAAKATASSITSSFPGNFEWPDCCRASWKRICEEFLFLVLQLAVRTVTELELQLAIASCGSSLIASPQEIVGKLVLHRLRDLGREAGHNFKDRLISAYDRDVNNGLKDAAKDVDIAAKCKPFGEHTNGLEYLKGMMLTYASTVIDRTLAELSDSFDQLVPFDWSSLNGRLPLARDVKGLRAKAWGKGDGGEITEVATEDEEIKAIWMTPIRTLWKDGKGEMILEGKMNIGLECDKGDNTKAATPKRITCMQTVQDEAYTNLVSNGLEIITTKMSAADTLIAPPSWEKMYAGPLFQTHALTIWKAMHCAAIDYCRPRLKKMLAQIYQVDALRTMLTSAPFHSGRLDFREMYKETIQGKKDSLKTEEAKLERLKRTLHAIDSGTELQQDGETPLEFKLEAARQSMAKYEEELKKAEAQRKKQAILGKMLRGALNASSQNAQEQEKIAEVAKKYFAMDSLLAKYKLEIKDITIAGTDFGKKDKVWFAGYWFKQEGWWGEDVKALKEPAPKAIEAYQRLFETDAMDAGGKAYVTLSGKDLSVELTTDLMYPLASFKVPPLFPWHEHVLCIEAYTIQQKGGYLSSNESNTKICSVMIPLAHALKGKKEIAEDLTRFVFEETLPFEVKAKTITDTTESIAFKFDRDGMQKLKGSETILGPRSEITVTIAQTFDAMDQPICPLEGDLSGFEPPPRT
jgi:hypothetical protein